MKLECCTRSFRISRHAFRRLVAATLAGTTLPVCHAWDATVSSQQLPECVAHVLLSPLVAITVTESQLVRAARRRVLRPFVSVLDCCTAPSFVASNPGMTRRRHHESSSFDYHAPRSWPTRCAALDWAGPKRCCGHASSSEAALRPAHPRSTWARSPICVIAQWQRDPHRAIPPKRFVALGAAVASSAAVEGRADCRPAGALQGTIGGDISHGDPATTTRSDAVARRPFVLRGPRGTRRAGRCSSSGSTPRSLARRDPDASAFRSPPRSGGAYQKLNQDRDFATAHGRAAADERASGLRGCASRLTNGLPRRFWRTPRGRAGRPAA